MRVWRSWHPVVTSPSLVFNDITDRKKAEEALRESEDKYRTVVENMQDVFYRTDMEGTIT